MESGNKSLLTFVEVVESRYYAVEVEAGDQEEAMALAQEAMLSRHVRESDRIHYLQTTAGLEAFHVSYQELLKDSVCADSAQTLSEDDSTLRKSGVVQVDTRATILSKQRHCLPEALVFPTHERLGTPTG